jgi:hypothetical protein
MTRALICVVLTSCVAPQPMGLSRVQVCLTAETASHYDRPKPSKGASLCADFEPPPAAE